MKIANVLLYNILIWELNPLDLVWGNSKCYVYTSGVNNVAEPRHHKHTWLTSQHLYGAVTAQRQLAFLIKDCRSCMQLRRAQINATYTECSLKPNRCFNKFILKTKTIVICSGSIAYCQNIFHAAKSRWPPDATDLYDTLIRDF